MNSEDQPDRLDPRLAAAYEALRDESSVEMDWERMRSSISRRAEPIIARRKVRRIVAIPRALVPLAMAAGIAFALWLGPQLLLQTPGASEEFGALADLEDEAALLQALDADLSEQEFRMVVTGRANPEALLAVAVADD